MRSFTPVRAHLWLIAVLILAPRPPFLSGPYRHHATPRTADLHALSTLHGFKVRRSASQVSYRALPRDLIEPSEFDPQGRARVAVSHWSMSDSCFIRRVPGTHVPARTLAGPRSAIRSSYAVEMAHHPHNPGRARRPWNFDSRRRDSTRHRAGGTSEGFSAKSSRAAPRRRLPSPLPVPSRENHMATDQYVVESESVETKPGPPRPAAGARRPEMGPGTFRAPGPRGPGGWRILPGLRREGPDAAIREEGDGARAITGARRPTTCPAWRSSSRSAAAWR